MPTIIIHTSLGDMTATLYDDTPRHRDNFLKLCRERYYDGVLFHRVIKGFMIQAGDPQSKNQAGKLRRQLGAGDIGYTIEHEIMADKHFHRRGALAAARTSDEVNPEKRSSGCQFYIVQGKKYGKRELKRMEDALTEYRRNGMEQRLLKPRAPELLQARMNGDHAALSRIHAEIEAEIAKQVQPFTFTEEQKEVYVNEGGMPSLDGDYTVFGCLTDGFDVLDEIAKQKTDRFDRPMQDVVIEGIEVVE